MSDSHQTSTSTKGVEDQVATGPLLEEVLAATAIANKETVMKSLMGAFVKQVIRQDVTLDRNLPNTINKMVAALDAQISDQLNEILHNEAFLKLEGSWRGLHYLVHQSETSETLKIRLLQVTKREVDRDISRAKEFDQSELFKRVYESEFGTSGGRPYATLVADFEFDNSPQDIRVLQGLAGIGAAAFAPVLTAASASMFGIEDFRSLSVPRDLSKIFEGNDYIEWRSFRKSPDARFVALILPRVLARTPYGKGAHEIDAFDYQEAPLAADGTTRQAMPHQNLCWMNAAYALATRMTAAFADTGWTTQIRGHHTGGQVEGLPTYTFVSDDGDARHQCPTEVSLTDRREGELSKNGFLPLCHHVATNFAVFYGAQTAFDFTRHDKNTQARNAAAAAQDADLELSGRLPYMMATSRFAHYLKILGREMLGTSLEKDGIQEELQKWINKYTNGNDKADDAQRARYPLREAEIEVREVPGKPGAYNAIARLRPWLQMEQLTASLTLTARMTKEG